MVGEHKGEANRDAHRRYIESRVDQGCHSPRQIWKEFRDLATRAAVPQFSSA